MPLILTNRSCAAFCCFLVTTYATTDVEKSAIAVMITGQIYIARACPGFLKGGGSNISWFPKKKVIRFEKGGVQWSDGGGSSTLVSIERQILHI